MKQLAILLCSALCIFLTACTQNNTAALRGSIKSTSLQESAAYQKVLNVNTAAFRTASKELKGYTSSQAVFYVFEILDDGSKLIYYTDFASLQRVVLCSQPNCNHNSDVCPAWIDEAKGEIMLAAVGEKLAIIYTNYYPMESAASPSIELMDANGRTRKCFVRFPLTGIFPETF